MENNLKHSDLACSFSFFFLEGVGANTDGASQCPSTGTCLAPEHCVILCAIETLGLYLGGPCPTASQGELYFRRIHIPGGKEAPFVPVGSSQQFLGEDSAVTQQLMLVGLSLAPCARRSECPRKFCVPLCHQSHLLSPFLCPGPCWLQAL